VYGNLKPDENSCKEKIIWYTGSVFYQINTIGEMVMGLGEKLKFERVKRGISQEEIAKRLGHKTNSYVSEVEGEKIWPAEEKLKIWAEVLGMSWEEMEDLILEAKLEELGISDPAFTVMFKEIPKMTPEEKKSILRAYEAVRKMREKKKKT